MMPQRSVQKPKSMISSKFDGEKPLYIFNITRTYTERQKIVLLGIKFCSFLLQIWGVFVFVTKALRKGGASCTDLAIWSYKPDRCGL